MGSTKPSVFGPELADCSNCELRASCAQRSITADIGKDYKPGGMMIIGEGPGTTEISQGKPFVGPQRKLLEALMSAAGVTRDDCWLTHATLGLAPNTKGKAQSFHKRFPEAIYSCVPRLEAEIEAARPRVIFTLGPAALTAVTGRVVEHSKLQPFDCDGGCDEKRKVGPALVCATGDCGWHALVPSMLTDEDAAWCGMAADAQAEALKVWRTEVVGALDGKCPKCEAKITRLRPRMMKCPKCGGRKTREIKFTTFADDYKLIGREGAAGAVFRTETLQNRLDELGVKYIIPTYAPSFCTRPIKDGQKRIGGQYAARAALAHLEKAKSLLKRDAFFDYSVKTTRDPKVVREWLEARRGKRIATDIETDSEDGPWAVTKVTCIGFATADDREALVVDTRHIPWWRQLAGRNQTEALLDELQLFLEDPEQFKVTHNGTYDRVVTARLWGVMWEGVVGDTMLAHNACYPDEEHGLGFVAHELTDAPMWKGERKKIPKGMTNEFSGYANFESLADYNAKDDRLTALCDERFEGGLIKMDGVRAAYDLDLEMQTIAVEMELNGLPISKARLAAIESEYQGVCDGELEAMRDIAGNDSFVPRGEALVWALYDPMGPCMLPVPGTTATGKPSTKKDHLLKMAHEPFIQHLLKWRKYDYHLSHYVRSEALTPAADGRVHPTWKVTGARTGRWSSEPNFQNWPKTMRKVVVAPPGRKIVGADYSQLEMRILATMCGDAELIRRCAEADETDKLNPDKDPHAYVASMAFGRTYVDAYRNGDVARCTSWRDIAKRVVYGLNYGAGAATVLEAVLSGGYEGSPLSISLIEEVRDTYFRVFPGVPSWRANQLRLATETEKVQSPIIGRHRIFPLGQIDATVIYNFPIQSGAADIMSTQLRVLADALPTVDPSAMLIAQVHDAIYAECDAKLAPAVARCIEESLTCELSIVAGAPSMPFIASSAISDNWKDAA